MCGMLFVLLRTKRMTCILIDVRHLLSPSTTSPTRIKSDSFEQKWTELGALDELGGPVSHLHEVAPTVRRVPSGL